MKHMKSACLVAFCIVAAACTSAQKKENNFPAVHEVKPYEHNVIALENLTTRVIAYCYASEEHSAEECAKALEEKSFVRLTEIPRFTADRDFLTTGTYPTRRWREGDTAPRW